jgi:hypothetical protein
MKSFTIESEDQWYNIPEEKINLFRNLIGDKRRGRVLNTGFFVNDSNQIRLVSKFLKNATTAFYHDDYNGGGSWAVPNTIENMIWTLKNDVDPFPERLPSAVQQLYDLIGKDLPEILQRSGKNRLTLCVVPRSKREDHYREDQLLFREIISRAIDRLPNFENGTKYIIRNTNTRTTHLDKNGEGGDGNLPYPGITKETCTISDLVRDKDILLIDDLYTKSVNVDEDAIQALYDKGARSVIFYSVGKTLSRQITQTAANDSTDDDDLPF